MRQNTSIFSDQETGFFFWEIMQAFNCLLWCRPSLSPLPLPSPGINSAEISDSTTKLSWPQPSLEQKESSSNGDGYLSIWPGVTFISSMSAKGPLSFAPDVLLYSTVFCCIHYHCMYTRYSLVYLFVY